MRRTDALAVALGCDVQDLPEILGFSRASLFGYRSGKLNVSSKALAKLEAAELKAGIRPDAGKFDAPIAVREEFHDYASESKKQGEWDSWNFLERTDALAARLGIDLGELAQRMGVGRTSFFCWRTAKRPITGRAWAKLAELERLADSDGALSLVSPQFKEKASIEDRLDEIEAKLDELASAIRLLVGRVSGPVADVAPITCRTQLPYLGLVAAGKAADVDYWSDETLPVHRDYGPEHHYLLRVHGRSMEPDYPDGCLIVVRAIAPGEVPPIPSVVVANDGTGPTVKRLEIDNAGRYRLQSINPEFGEVVPVPGSCPIQGLVVDRIL